MIYSLKEYWRIAVLADAITTRGSTWSERTSECSSVISLLCDPFICKAYSTARPVTSSFRCLMSFPARYVVVLVALVSSAAVCWHRSHLLAKPALAKPAIKTLGPRRYRYRRQLPTKSPALGGSPEGLLFSCSPRPSSLITLFAFGLDQV